ncbi:MAG: hypothetical protein WB676_05295 [Bryobacteraceae bacterium]
MAERGTFHILSLPSYGGCVKYIIGGITTFDTVVAATCAVLVFLAKARYSLEPVREYRALAAKVLVVSFVPAIALAVLHGFGGGWPEALALMAMHVAVWAICVTLLPALTMTGGGPDSATPSLPHNRYEKG